MIINAIGEYTKNSKPQPTQPSSKPRYYDHIAMYDTVLQITAVCDKCGTKLQAHMANNQIRVKPCINGCQRT